MVRISQFYLILLDKSKDKSKKALPFCFVRVECEGELQEELICSQLPG